MIVNFLKKKCMNDGAHYIISKQVAFIFKNK